MKLKTSIVFALSVIFFAAHAESQHSKDTQWSYDGDSGPDHWATLQKDWATCSEGHEQSPIDLRWKKPKRNHTVRFFYNETPAEIVDNGHTVQVNFKPGSKVDISGKVFDLVQLHFHTESEHTLSGQHFPLELHLVHQDTAGHLAVVSVMFKVGQKNEWIEKLWSEIPHKKDQTALLKSKVFNPAKLLPSSNTHYHYMGSLTTPPCSQGVDWNVLNTPLELSLEQLKTFQKIYAHNNRPVQSLFTRRPANF